MDDIANSEYAEWMEELVKTVFEKKPRAMAFTALLDGEDVLTGYYNANARDKAVFAHNIQCDIIMDVIENNAGTIRQMLENVDD